MLFLKQNKFRQIFQFIVWMCLISIQFFNNLKFTFAAHTANPNQLYPDLSGTDLMGVGIDPNLEEDILPTMMDTILKIVGVTMLVILLYSGILMITSFGNSEQRDKAKKMVYYALLGIVFIVLAYAIVKGITQLQFNN